MHSLPNPTSNQHTLNVGPRQFGCTPVEVLVNPRLSDKAVRLYGLIAGRYVDYQTKSGIVSRRQLAADLSYSLATIRRCLAELRRAEVLLIRHRQNARNSKLPSEFVILSTGQKLGHPRVTGDPTLGSRVTHQRSDLKIRKERTARARVPGFMCEHDVRCDTRHACIERTLTEARAERAALVR